MWAWMYGCTTKSIFWICGCTARWMLGCMVAPQNKSLDVRLHHKMDAWMHGCTTVNTDPYQNMSGPNETKIRWGAIIFASWCHFRDNSFASLEKLVCQFHGDKRQLEPGWCQAFCFFNEQTWTFFIEHKELLLFTYKSPFYLQVWALFV